MTFEQSLFFTTCCGLLGVLLRRNFLSIQVAVLQVVTGLNALFAISFAARPNDSFYIYLLIALIFTVVIFFYTVAVLLIRRRSTLNVNELTELRG